MTRDIGEMVAEQTHLLVVRVAAIVERPRSEWPCVGSSAITFMVLVQPPA